MTAKTKYGTLLCLFLTSLSAIAQVRFIPNMNQWNDGSLFHADIPSGRIFFGDHKITYTFFSANDVNRIHHQLDTVRDPVTEARVKASKINCYAFEVQFAGASEAATMTGADKASAVCSYFIGNDTSKWRGAIPMYNTLLYSSVYPGIDLKYSSQRDALKYDFILHPHANADDIQMVYSGQQSLTTRDGALEIGAGFLTVREVIPAAYQIVGGKRVDVPCVYRVQGNTVRFAFPDGYDHDLELVIDPELVASTNSGGTCMSFGFTATYDPEGNIYVGGICFGQGFPTTLGAYDATYNGSYDIGISKFDPTGSNLIYCTYVGGITEDQPFSMFERDGRLYVYGNTNSPDFPVTAGAYDQTYGGMHDIVVFCLNADASALIGSTFVGANMDDGINYVNVNLGDNARGEIVLDANGDVYIASGSNSAAFPVTAGAYNTTNNGGVDAVIFKMNAALTGLIWGTFLGGSLNDSGMSLRVDQSGNVFVGGSMRGALGGLPMVASSYQPTYHGGASDAYIAKFNSTGSALLGLTFIGSAGQDLGYFVDEDADGDVYMIGETAQGVTITSDVYNVPGSTTFIVKLDNSLTNLLFSTVIGDGTTQAKLIPSAFMVDHCKRIFFGGFGTSPNWPLTPDALYTWNGEYQFYLATLEENASSLLFGTMYGGWHVDGGTSRFDPNGVVYQAVCQDSGLFPTTPWAYADGSADSSWDICVFKIDFQIERDTAILPNVFTPNGDGINDVYDVGLMSTRTYDLRIYDRWGVEVFHSDRPEVKWDGTFHKKDCPDGVYYVVLQHGYCSDTRYTSTGFVHLIRNPN